MDKETIKQIASIAWKGAANAFRLYPNNNHTFIDYWEGAEVQFKEFLKPKWISVKDSVPETNEDVLVYYGTLPRPIISFYDAPYGWGGKDLKVEFWMPMPEFPNS